MREWSKPATTLLLGLGLGAFCLYFYLSHLSFNYTFDGLAFSSQVEKDDTPTWLFFHPHHLIYTFLGRLFFVWGKEHGATWDGLVALQFFDLLTGVMGVLIAFHLLVRETNDRLVSFLAAAGLALSHSYWYFSTIPGVRVFATVTPLFAWYVLTYLRRIPPAFGWVVGAAHGLAVLGHQTNLLLVPAFLAAILCFREKTLWEKSRAIFYYLTALTALVLAAYGFVGRFINYKKNFHDWLWWVCSYFHATKKWGGHFNESGFDRGQSAMVRAFLQDVLPVKPLNDSITFGAVESVLQYAILALLVVLLLRFKYYWDRHRGALLVSVLWIAAFVPFFVWWEPWNIEFWVSSTIPCWILMGLVASDLARRWKDPVLHFANRGIVLGAWATLIFLLFSYNVQGNITRTPIRTYDFKQLLVALDWKVKPHDLLVLNGINNVHYYLDRFQKRSYLSLYSFFLKRQELERQMESKAVAKGTDEKEAAPIDPWEDLSALFKETWEKHHKVYVLTETVNDFPGGRQLLEETLHLPQGRFRTYFTQYQLKPVAFHHMVFFYEVEPPPSFPAPAADEAPVDGKTKE